MWFLENIYKSLPGAPVKNRWMRKKCNQDRKASKNRKKKRS